MSKISLKHSGGNVVSLNSPTNAPSAADVAFKLPNADGSAGQFMKTDGSGNLSFDAVSSDYVKLQAAASTTAVADLTFQSLDVTTYRTFKMIFSGYPVTDSAELHFRFRDGSTEKTATAYNWGNLGVTGAGSVFDNAGEQNKALIAYNAGNNNYEGWRLELTVVPHVSGDPDYQNNFGMSSVIRYTSSNSFRGENFWFKYHQSDTVNGFRIYPSSGNIAAYSYTLYGLKR